ncbi:cytochrome P450 [Coprinopsis sp. MPI-PUGE-AT-0042]|nr:cytochrome P450 [Coprinopsis sp. MPI-PUGE-AT-0042]
MDVSAIAWGRSWRNFQSQPTLREHRLHQRPEDVKVDSNKYMKVSAKDLVPPFNYPWYSAASAHPAKEASAFSNAEFVIADHMVKPHMEAVNRFVHPFIEDALRKNAANPKGAESNEIEADETLLDHLVRSTSDHKLLRDETLNILLAGCNTYSAALTFTAYLAMHPEFIKKLGEEILTQIGPSKAPTYDDAGAMKYLQAVTNESMRLLHPVPNDVRACANGGIWPSPNPNDEPIHIPPGTAPILVHMRKDLWGPDSDEFEPDRFIDDRVKEYLVTNPFIFIPFNAGPRICLGQQIKLMGGSVKHLQPEALAGYVPSLLLLISFRSNARLTPGNGGRLLMPFTYFALDRALEVAIGYSTTTRNNVVMTIQLHLTLGLRASAMLLEACVRLDSS